MWKYTKDYTDLALTKQSAALHKKQTLVIFVILLHTITTQSFCWNYIRRYLKIGTNADTYVDTTVIKTFNSLQHMCRLSIRSNLAKNFSLPEGVNELPLPIRIKSYLQLNDIQYFIDKN